MLTLLSIAACASATESGPDGRDAVTEPASGSTGSTQGSDSSPTIPTTTTPPTARIPPTSAAPATTAVSTTTSSTTTIPPTTTTIAVGPVACPPTGDPIWEIRPPSDLPAPDLPAGWTTAGVGSSVQGRDITALVHPVDGFRRRVLVIGGLHGNEPVSPPTVRGLVTADHGDDTEVWLVPEANPDGVAAGMRCNANGVDLNRNFGWDWRPEDGGPSAASEPETQALVRLVESLQPDVVVWVHQPYGYVASIGPTPDALQQAWAVGAGIPVRPNTTQHGGGESWTAFVAQRPSMLIEIDTWSATAAIVDAHRAGYEAMLDALG